MTLTDGNASFGTLVKTFRRSRRRTQQHLADALGVNRSTLFRWERGDYLPESKGQVLELARCLTLDDQETRQLLEASLTALAPYWHIPFPRNLYFTGREEILEVLHTQLSADQAVALTQSSALYGLGGVGKTQIALEYAYRHAPEYRAVFWIGAETPEQVVSSLLRVAEVLQLPERENKDPQRVVAAVQHWLISHGQWLLIWDNVEDLDVLHHFLPTRREGAILITTRRQALGTLARNLDLLPMEHKEGILFLLRRAKVFVPEGTHEQVRQFAIQAPAQYTAAVALVTELGGLPLALDQAGAYLEETRCGFPAYLERFRTQRAALLKLRGEESREHPASVFTTFTLAIAATTEHHPAVRDLLQVCALLQPDAIPEEMFRQAGDLLGPTLQAVCFDALAWDRMVSVAYAYSLLSRHPETRTISLHRLVQAVVLDSMSEEEREQWSERVIATLERLFPVVVMVSEQPVWKQCERLLAHAQLNIQRMGKDRQSLPLAELASNVGCFLRLQARDAEAEALFRRSLSIQEHALGPRHSDVASSLNNIALVSFNLGRYEELESLFERSLSIQEQERGPLHPEVATVLNNWAFTLRDRGKYSKARPLFERSLAIREHVFGPLHPDVASSLKNLADLYLMQGQYLQAEQLVRRAISIHEQAQGSSHPQLVRPLDTLANLLRDQGAYSEAERLYLRGLAIWEQHLGPEYPRRAVLLDDLAECYRLQQRDAEAESLYRQTLAIREQMMERSELYVSIPLLGLANLARDQGRSHEADQFYQRALVLREQYLGEQHPETATILHHLALLRQKQGQMGEALSLAKRALSICLRSLGDSHPQTITTRTLYAHFVQEQPALEHPPKTHEQIPREMMNVAVRGVNGQVAYTRRVNMRAVTFTCTICGQTVTQLHYPSGHLKYCSDACRAVNVTEQQEARVARQRERRRIAREARRQAQQE